MLHAGFIEGLLLVPAGVCERNVVMWMDHRAAEQAARITDTGHRVLRGVGGVMSPEMQPPKLLWLKEVQTCGCRPFLFYLIF